MGEAVHQGGTRGTRAPAVTSHSHSRSNVILLILNLPLVGVWVKLLAIPKQYLAAGILVFASIGVYGMRQSAFDLVLMLAIGWAGVAMRRFDFPVAPVIVGMLLGPMAEKQLRNALSISQGDWLVFLKQPLSASIVAITALEVSTYFWSSWFGDASHYPAIVLLVVMMVVKFVLIASFFMHLRFDTKLLSRIFYFGLIVAMMVYVAALATMNIFTDNGNPWFNDPPPAVTTTTVAPTGG